MKDFQAINFLQNPAWKAWISFLFQSEPLWPGKSDLDQLFLIRRNLGDLLPKHMECFKNNEYFFGLSIPDPGTLIPIEKRVPKELAGFDGVNFLKVTKLILFVF